MPYGRKLHLRLFWMQQGSNAGGDAPVFVDCSEIQSSINNVKGLKLISWFILGIYCRP